MQPLHLLLIALGGGAGAVMRYLVFLAFETHASTDFPLGTLAANVLGCLCIGFAGTMLRLTDHPLHPELRMMLVVGVLGGFTTFSTFGLETFDLIIGDQPGKAALYVVLTNVLGLGAVWLGFIAGQHASTPATH